MLETLRNLKPSKINHKSNKQSCIPNVHVKANEVREH